MCKNLSQACYSDKKFSSSVVGFLRKVVVHMLTQISSAMHIGRQRLRRLAVDPRLHRFLRPFLLLAAGFLLSAASLGNHAMPLAMGAVCACQGWSGLLVAAGSCLGYLLFWEGAGAQGVIWMTGAALITLLLGRSAMVKSGPYLLSAMSALVTAATGLYFQMRLADTTSLMIFLLRILLSAGSTAVFSLRETRRTPMTEHLTAAMFVLALAQIAPLPWLGLGFLAGGAMWVSAPFPAAALAGLALDLAQVTPVPMTAVACMTWFARQLPVRRKWPLAFAPAAAGVLVMSLCGLRDWMPLPGLLLGGVAGSLLPGQQKLSHRRGETGIAQVRLEMTAGVFTQIRQQLLETQELPIDEEALIRRAAERACGSCSLAASCNAREAAANMSAQLLHKPLLDGADLPVACQKDSRMLLELHRCQEQLRALRSDRQRQLEYRSALLQQYQFLAEYMQDLSDKLGQRTTAVARYRPETVCLSNRNNADNGDRCLFFSGPDCRFYALLCDGMGTGFGAIREGKSAGSMLQQLLSAGFPAQYALRSLNSLYALRGTAGACTVDLAEICLDTGKVNLYKWGAPPSYLLTEAGCEKIGTVGPPPGLSVKESREITERLSLRRGETLVLVSDGAGGEDALRCSFSDRDEPLGELAARILEEGNSDNADDATVAVIRLHPDSLSA